MSIPDFVQTQEFLADGIGSKLHREFVKHLENHSSNFGRPWQGIFQQFPYTFGYWTIVPIHPEAIPRRATSYMYFHHAIQRHSVNGGEWIDTVIQLVAVNVMKVKQHKTAAAFHDCIDQADIVPDLRIRWKLCNVICGILQKKWNAITAANLSRPVGDKAGSLPRGWHGQRNTDFESRAIVVRNRLKPKMLAVPHKWPCGLKSIEHLKIGIVPAMRRAN